MKILNNLIIISFLIITLNICQLKSAKIPPFLKDLMDRYKLAFIKRTIMDRTSEVLGYRDIGHAATVMKNRVHKIDKIMALTENFKSEVDYLSYTITTSYERIFETLSKQLAKTDKFSRVFGKIEKYMMIIESKYNEFLLLNLNAKRGDTNRLIKFAEELVDSKDNSVYDSLNKLNSILSGSEIVHMQLSDNSFNTLIEFLETKSSGVQKCKSITASMEVLHTFVQSIIIIFIKGRVLVQYGYNMKHLVKSDFNTENDTLTSNIIDNRYKTEIKLLDTLIVQSIERLILNFMKSTSHLRPFNYNCRPDKGYQEHENYERFINFLTPLIAGETYLKHPYKRTVGDGIKCSHDCNFFDLSYKSDPTMVSCVNGLMRNCKKFLEAPEVCLIPSKTQLFSKNIENCPKNHTRTTTSKVTADFFKCDICSCTCDTQTGQNFIYTGSVLAPPGQVVAGIRFVKSSHNALYLSILSGAPNPMGFVDTRNATWFQLPENEKPLDNRHKYYRLAWWCRTFVLSDVKLERYYVVTGVQFVMNSKKCMINLRVFGTMINILYGKLIPNSTKGISVKPSYKEEDKIKLEDLYSGISDTRDILMTGEKTTKIIDLANTPITEDLSQIVIPFFDTQPLVSEVSVVQAGVGLFHRSTDKYAGFISPRLIAFNFTDYFLDVELIKTLETNLKK